MRAWESDSVRLMSWVLTLRLSLYVSYFSVIFKVLSADMADLTASFWSSSIEFSNRFIINLLSLLVAAVPSGRVICWALLAESLPSAYLSCVKSRSDYVCDLVPGELSRAVAPFSFACPPSAFALGEFESSSAPPFVTSTFYNGLLTFAIFKWFKSTFWLSSSCVLSDMLLLSVLSAWLGCWPICFLLASTTSPRLLSLAWC